MSRLQDLIDTVDTLIEQIEECYTPDLRITKELAFAIHEELESLVESEDIE